MACGGGGTNGGMMTGDDEPPPPDGGDITPPTRGFQIVSPDIDIAAHQEITYCYYFRTPNTEPMAVHKWVSKMTPGSHHLIMFTTGTQDKKAPGTIDTANCGFTGGGLNLPNWTYSAQTPDAELELPTDDGAGKPLAIDIPANTAGFVQMHYFNPSDEPIKAHITINAEALDATAPYTKTAAFVTYNASITIDRGATNFPVAQTCTTPPNVKFWLMSTHAHKQAIKTEVLDGNATTGTAVFTSNNWEHPGAQAWMTSPFYAFESGQVTYRCTYNNPSTEVIHDGDSAASDEMCMASGYYFPGSKGLICYDGNFKNY
jgi:hypothetical protein